MNRKITPEETTQLFAFCGKHQVHYYDLQIELVDHLASAIEMQWKTDLELDFNKALKMSFGKFGIYGFSKIKDKKEKELRRKYNRLLWKFFLEFYKLPKIIMTFVFTIGMFTLFQFVNNIDWIFIGYFIISIIIGVLYLLYYHKKIKVKTVSEKSFLLIEQLSSYISLLSLVYTLPNLFFQFSKFFKIFDNQLYLFLISFLLVAFTIFMYGYLVFIPKKIKEHFMEHFAEFAV